MNCNKFEELILDYIQDNLDEKDNVEILSHKNICNKCSELYNQYFSIRTVLNQNDDITLNPDLLENIKTIAKKSVEKERKSFFKNLFKSPVLVPAFGMAIALIFVVNHGQDYLRNKTVVDETATNSVVEDKIEENISQVILENSDRENGNRFEDGKSIKPNQDLDDLGAMVGKNISLEPKVEKPLAKKSKKDERQRRKIEVKGGGLRYENRDIGDKKSLSSKDGIESDSPLKNQPKLLENEPITSEKEILASRETRVEIKKESSLGQEAVSENEINISNKPSVKTEVKKRESEALSSPAVAASKKVDVGYFRKQIDQVTLLQYTGNCADSIKEADKLLNSDPQPPIPIQQSVFISKAECYEELKDYKNAIETYRKLEAIDPEKKAFISRKITELNNQIVK